MRTGIPEVLTTDTEADAGTSAGVARRLGKLSDTAKICRSFAGSDVTFISLDYISDSRESAVVLDPYKAAYRLLPGSNVKKMNVNDIRPLLLDQINAAAAAPLSPAAAAAQLSPAAAQLVPVADAAAQLSPTAAATAHLSSLGPAAAQVPSTASQVPAASEVPAPHLLAASEVPAKVDEVVAASEE